MIRDGLENIFVGKIVKEKKNIYQAGADTAHNSMGRSARKIGLGGVSAAGGSAPILQFQ